MSKRFVNSAVRLLSGVAAAVFVASHLMFPVSADSYSGISIDGDFSDWDSVVKYDALGNTSFVNQVAMVWDGDWVYIYLDEVQQNSATWSGAKTDGKFVIKTDLNQDLVVALYNNGANGNRVEVTQPDSDLYLSDTNGKVKVAFNGDYSTWGEPSLMEIAIPADALPQYSSTISFGYYLGNILISDVADSSGLSGGATPTPGPHNDGSGIVIDGEYHDWDYYPVTTIEYDTAGTNNSHPDARGSILSRDGKAYVHCVTNYFAEQDTGFRYGAEFLEVIVHLGDTFTMLKAVKIGPNGGLDWKAEYNSQPYGEHHFALFYSGDAELSTNINNISQYDTYLGDMYIEVGEYQNQTEFWFDVEKLAERANVSLTEATNIRVRFHRIGRETLRCSGISTGPAFVALLSTVAVGSYLTINRRKKA